MEHTWKDGDIGVARLETVPQKTYRGVYTTTCTKHAAGQPHFHTNGTMGWKSVGAGRFRPVMLVDPDDDESLKAAYRVATTFTLGARALERMRRDAGKAVTRAPDTCPEKVRIGDRDFPCTAPMPHGKGDHKITETVSW